MNEGEGAHDDEGSTWYRRSPVVLVAIVTLLAAALAAVVMQRDTEEAALAGETEVKSEVVVAPPSAPPTTEPVPDGPVAPLTGVRLFQADAALVDRPALVAKVDNDPAANPQRGLEQADVVVELRVEGISRFMAVFHSSDVESVSPIRSARTSDTDLLAMLGRPLFGWSGANEATVRDVKAAPWIHNVDAGTLASAYSRSSERRAPHNLVLDARRAFAEADADSVAPAPLFHYVAPGQDPGGVPVTGFDVSIGSSAAGFVWNQPRSSWLRWTNGEAHLDTDDEQIGAANVVVLETDYVDSHADVRSPEAQTLGIGRAWVFTQGRLIEGSWSRAERTQAWQIVDAAGEPVLLAPGATWVELPDRGTVPKLLDAPAA